MKFGDKTLSKLSEPRSLHEWLELLSASALASVVILIVANLVCYYKTLGGYFLADDFVHVAYLKQVFDGHPELLAKNFYSNWLQTEGTIFYRPFISITLALDYLISGVNPVAFHVSNFIYQCLSSIFLYWIVRELLQLFSERSLLDGGVAPGPTRPVSSALPLITGLVFATHPLHPEVVSWIIARVDSVCAAFYLLSLALFLHSLRKAGKTRLLLAASLGSFVLSLMSKEMAATLPLSLTLLLVLFPSLLRSATETSQSAPKESRMSALKNAFIATWPFWLVLLLYLGFRSVALGAIAGGYQGSIGEGLSNSTWQRIFSLSSMQTVVFPLNAEVFVPLKRWVRPLAIVYVVAFVLFAIRLFTSPNRGLVLKTTVFSILWFLIVMLPAVPVWNLTEVLQGSRFIYLGTAPLCLFIAMILSPFAGHAGANELQKSDADKNATVNAFSTAAALCLIVLYGAVAYKNNSVWAHAGTELRNLRDEIQNTVQKFPEREKVAIFNVPHKYKGAHMLYNAATLSVLLEPPLTPPGIYERVITFEPAMFGDEDLIRISRVRKLLAGNHHFFQWNRHDQVLEAVNLAPAEGELSFDKSCATLDPIDVDSRGNYKNAGAGSIGTPGKGHLLKDNAVLLTPVLDIEPNAVDFLDLCVSTASRQDAATGTSGTDDSNRTSAENADPLAPVPIVVQWNTDQSSSFDKEISFLTNVPTDKKSYKLRLHVSEHKKWLEKGKIHRLAIWSPASRHHLLIEGLSLKIGKRSIPELEAGKDKFAEDSSGIARGGGKKGRFSYDATAVEGAQSVLFEVSQPNAWFEHYSNTYRDSVPSPKALKSWKSDVLKQTEATFPLNELGGPGFYELRVAATKQNGEIVGYFSDPIMFQVGQ